MRAFTYLSQFSLDVRYKSRKKHVMSIALFKLFIIKIKLINYNLILNIYIVTFDFFFAQFAFLVELINSNIKTKKLSLMKFLLS